MNSFKTPMESFSTKVDQEMFSELMKPSFRLAKESLEANVDLFSFSCSERVKETLSLMGIQLSPFPLFSHSHPACKMIENQILYKVLPNLLGNKSWTVMSTKKEKFLKICKLGKVDRMHSNLINRLVVNKDFSRYSELPPIDWIEPVCNLTKKIRNHGLFIHDEIHHWSKSTLFTILKGCPNLNEVVATVVYPVELLRGEVASHFPELYEFELIECCENDEGYFDDSSGQLSHEDRHKLIFAPDGVYSEAYEQRADLNFLFEASHFLVDGQVWTVSKVCTYGAHHVFSFARGDFKTESIRVWGNFKTVDLTALNKFRKNSEFPPIRKDSIDKVYSYLKCLKKPDVQSGIAKARQLLAETLTAPETIFYEKLCSLILNHRSGVNSQQCFGTSFFGDAYLKFVLALPSFISRLIPSSSEKFLFDFLRTLDFFRVRVPTRRVALYEPLILNEAELVINEMDKNFKGSAPLRDAGSDNLVFRRSNGKGRPYRISSTWAEGFEFIFRANPCCKFWVHDLYLGTNLSAQKAKEFGREYSSTDLARKFIEKIAVDSNGNQLQICWSEGLEGTGESMYVEFSDCFFLKDYDGCGSRQLGFYYSSKRSSDESASPSKTQLTDEDELVEICDEPEFCNLVTASAEEASRVESPVLPIVELGDAALATEEMDVISMLKENPSLKAVIGSCSHPISEQFSDVKGDGHCFVYAMEKASGMMFNLIHMQGVVERNFGIAFSNEFKLRCFDGWHNEVSVAAFSNCLGLNICVHIDGGSKTQFYSPIREGEFDKVCVALHASNHFNTLFKIEAVDVEGESDQESAFEFNHEVSAPQIPKDDENLDCPGSLKSTLEALESGQLGKIDCEDSGDDFNSGKTCVINALSSACGKGVGSIFKFLRELPTKSSKANIDISVSEHILLDKVNGGLKEGLNTREFGLLISILKRHSNYKFRNLSDQESSLTEPSNFFLTCANGTTLDLISNSEVSISSFNKLLSSSCCFFEVSREHVVHLSQSNRKKIWELNDFGLCLDLGDHSKISDGLSEDATEERRFNFNGDEVPYLVRFDAAERLAEAFEKGDVGLIMQACECVSELSKLVQLKRKKGEASKKNLGAEFGLWTSSTSPSFEGVSKFEALLGSKGLESGIVVSLKVVFGFGGSGKSFDFINKVNQLPKSLKGLVVSPRDFLCKDISSKINNKNCKVLTFEKAIEWAFTEGASIDYILFDEFTLLPAGYLDLMICIINNVALEVVLIGDPLQARDFQRCCDYLAPIHEIDLIGQTSGRIKDMKLNGTDQGEITEVFRVLTKKKGVCIEVIEYRMYSRRFGNHPLFSNDFDFTGEEDISLRITGDNVGDPMKVTFDFLEDLTMVASKVESDIIHAKKENVKEGFLLRKGAKKSSLSSNLVSTISKSQGLTKSKVKIYLTQSIELIDDLTWMVALTRCSRSLEFVNISGRSLNALADKASSKFLSKSLRGERITKKDLIEKLSNYEIVEQRKFGNEISREEKLAGDLFLRPYLFLGANVGILESHPSEVKCSDPQPKCHIPIMHSNYPALKSHEMILMKEVREKRLGSNWTDQFIEQRRGQTKEVELTSNPYMFEAIFPRHKNSDTATFWMAVAKRIRFSDEGSERRNLRKSKLIGISMCDALLKRFPVKRRIDRGSIEKGRFDFEEKKVSKSLSMIANNSGRSDIDWPMDRVFMFIKSQLCTKVAKQYCEAKAGQTLACFQHLVLVKFAPICRALEAVFRESLPENVYIHSNRNFDDLNAFCIKNFNKSGDMSVESDYEAFDSSQDHHVLAFEESFMRAYGVPESYITDYVDMKVTLGSKLGNFAIMRFTGEFGTFFLNTLANMAFTCMKYNLRGDEPMMFAGDDMCLFKNVNESGKYRAILDKLRLKAVIEKKENPFFCGWHLTKFGIIKDPELLLNRFMVAIESGKLSECIENYSIELSYAYRLGDKLISVLNEDLINCHHITIRTVIKNLNLIKGNIKDVFKGSDEIHKNQQPEGCVESWFYSN